MTHVAAPADVEQFYAMLRAKCLAKKKGVTRVAHAEQSRAERPEEGCYMGRTSDYVATEP